MPESAVNNKRIAKNTIALYFRAFITMIVGLYTSRVLLQVLGVENYGVQNVIGGIVAMSTILSSTTSQAISRFLTYELGTGNTERLKTVFSTSVNVQLILAVFTIIFLEIIGIWFLETKANIPDGRIVAARWVLQCSILTTVFGIVSSPYQAVIIAHEHMSIYAYFSIVEVMMKLGICYLVVSFGGDKLIVYSILLASVALIIASFYSFYCSRKFEEARYKVKALDTQLLKEMTSFSGWNLLGNTAWILNTQGINMLINVFFGVVFNAARGVANTVSGAISSFVGNFTTAFTPQIVKSYASGDKYHSFRLANRATKYTCLLMYFFIVPVFFESDIILELWLGNPPEYADVFLRFTLFESLAVTFGTNLLKVIQATGDIKRYEIEVSLYGLLVFPITWGCFKLGLPVWTSCISFIFIYFTLVYIELKALKRLANYPIMSFFKDVVSRIVLVLLFAAILPYVITCYMQEDTVIRLFVLFGVSILWTSLSIFIFGLESEERVFFKHYIRRVFSKV